MKYSIVRNTLTREYGTGPFEKATIWKDDTDTWQILGEHNASSFYTIRVGNDIYGIHAENGYTAGSCYETGARFTGITIPAAAYNIEAHLYVYVAYNYIDTHIDAKIAVEDSVTADPFPYSGTAANFKARALIGTVDTVEITDTPYWDASYKDFGSLIQALIDKYGALTDASIVVFWGDRNGETPTPPAGEANILISSYQQTIPTLTLRINYEVASPVDPDNSTYFPIEDTSIKDAKLVQSEEGIINDARILIPHYTTRMDYTQTPPVEVPVDFILYNTEDESQKKYGRRTLINHDVVGNWYYFGETWTHKTLRDKKEPVNDMSVSVIVTTDEMVKSAFLSTLKDKAVINIDEAYIQHERFHIDGKSMILHEDYIQVDYDLRGLHTTENILDFFQLDVDGLDDPARCLG